jgi:hypothetical protein
MGMATLVVTGTHDYRNETLTNITEIAFVTTADATATFSASQFGFGGIANNVAITGDAFANRIQVIMPGSPGSDFFSAAAWTFNNWVPTSDAVVLDGSAGNDTIIGSAQHDVINGGVGSDTITGGPGADTVNGGIGSDIFRIAVGDIVAGETIDGGPDFDVLDLHPAIGTTIDARGAAIINLETLGLGGNGTLLADGRLFTQLGGVGNTLVRLSGGGNSGFFDEFPRLIVEDSAVDLHNVDVATWFGDISINGTSATSNVLTGSSAKETITGHATGDNTIWGGFGGDDTLLGGSGKDTITGNDGRNILKGFGGNDILSGGANSDNIDGGAGDDTQTGGGALNAFQSAGSWTGAGNDSQGWYVGDFNGDHRDDIFRYNAGVSGAEVFLASFTGKSFNQPGSSWTGAGNDSQGWYVGDFNGDGRDDIFRYHAGVSGAEVFTSTGSSFTGGTSWTGAGNDAQGWYVGDFNGDGKDDIFRYNAGVSGAEVFLSNGSSFVSSGSWTGAGNDAQGWYVGDFNGDGRDDIFRYNAGVSGAEVFLSNGSSFVSAGSWTTAGNDGRWYVGDFNGDASDDIMRYNPGVSGGEVFLSNGSSFKSAGSWTPAGNGSQGWYVGDFNGNGAADVFRYLDGVSGADMWLSDPLSTADSFRFEAGGGRDVITDFQATGRGHDVVLVDKNMFADFTSLMAHAAQAGDDTVITYDAANTLTLNHILKSSLTQLDFSFF